MERRPYTPEEIALAVRLHEEHGLTWPQIAERFGRTANALSTSVSLYRNGKRKFWLHRMAEERAEMERLLLEQVPVRDIAERFEVSIYAVYSRLNYMGYDAELFREIRSGAWREAAE